jgi:hypothetical protein
MSTPLDMSANEVWDRAETVYIELVTSQFASRLNRLVMLNASHPTQLRVRQLRDAREALRAAQDDARVEFAERMRGT